MIDSDKFVEGQILYCMHTGGSVRLIKPIKTGGEGTIWETRPNPAYIAKLYREPKIEQLQKLTVMVANPPENPTKKDNHISIAWPERLLQDERGNFIGFLMPYIQKSVTLTRIYAPEYRMNYYPGFNWLCLHGTAQNIASIVWAIHQKGHLLCDMSPGNLLVDPENSYVSIIDTDSFQIWDSTTGKIYPSTVLGTPEFLPPELLKDDFSSQKRSEVHDRFQLGVIIYILLFGYSPFDGGWPFDEEIFGTDEFIRRGYWLHGQTQNKLEHQEGTIPLEILHPMLKECFIKCFEDGYREPSLRPTAEEWFYALQYALADLKICDRERNHFYSGTYGKCYWCEFDIFPPATEKAIESKSESVSLPSPLIVEIIKPNLWNLFKSKEFVFGKKPKLKIAQKLDENFYDIKALIWSFIIAMPIVFVLFLLTKSPNISPGDPERNNVNPEENFP